MLPTLKDDLMLDLYEVSLTFWKKHCTEDSFSNESFDKESKTGLINCLYIECSQTVIAKFSKTGWYPNRNSKQIVQEI